MISRIIDAIVKALANQTSVTLCDFCAFLWLKT
jgi:nucleoid DNA-binding protein